MTKNKHLHKFKRINIASEGKSYLVYKCIKPGCSYYIPLNQALNSICECSKCGDVMIIGKLQLYGSGGRSMANPHCAKCIKRKTKDVVDMETVQKFVKDKEIE